MLNKCGICGEYHSPSDCLLIQMKQYVLDKPILPKARLSLPDELEIQMLADCTYSIYAKTAIYKGTKFGPLQAKKLCTLLPTITFPLKCFSDTDEDLTEYYLDTSNEYECNWMMYIAAASNFDEQNLICFQDDGELFYVTIRDISAKEALKVWYSPYYALLMKKSLLNQPQIQEKRPSTPNAVDVLVEQNKNVTNRESWSCKFCGRMENKVVDFAKHLLEHYQAKMNKKCEKCGDSFLRAKDLQNHMKIVHHSSINATHEKMPVGISKSDQTIKTSKTSNDFAEKDVNVGGPLLLLGDLDQDSQDNSNLMMDQNRSKQYELNSFAENNHLLENDHMSLNVDGILLTDNVKEFDHFNFELNEPEFDQLICDLCSKSFEKIRLLIIHLAQHTGKYTCMECNKVFTRKENLKFHACTSFYKYKCSSCEKLFYQKKALTHHIKYAHRKEFFCKECSSNFTCKKKLDDHDCVNRNVPKKIFTCDVCMKVFTQKDNLNTHKKTHTKPNEIHTCPICNVKLNSRQTYSKHEKLHCGQYYQCDKCQKSFTRQDSLKYHIQFVHEKVQAICQLCNKVLASPRQLKKHMLIHTVSKDHKCNHCERTFKIKQQLTRHINSVHNSSKQRDNPSEKYFGCPKCDKRVKFKQSLLKHMRKHHPGDEQLVKVRWKNSRNADIFEEETELDLKQTIDNMNFNTDEINNYEAEINSELDQLLSGATNIEPYLDESNERLVESLINIAVKDENMITEASYQQKNICLSMPELTSSI